MTFRYFFTLCLLWSTAALLQGCGGGGDGKNTVADNSGGNATTAAVQNGVYYASVGGQDFWSMITPGNRWYGLHNKTNGYDIYSGELSGVETLNASVSALKYQNNAATNLDGGTATLTSAGLGKLSATLSLIANVNIQPISFINATKTHGFSNDSTASVRDIAGSWSGVLSFGVGINSQFTLVIDENSGAITATNAFYGCRLNPTTSKATSIPNANVFALTLNTTIEDVSTGCNPNLNGKSFSGVIFLEPSTLSSRPHLIGVATNPNGHAIAFKAERTTP